MSGDQRPDPARGKSQTNVVTAVAGALVIAMGVTGCGGQRTPSVAAPPTSNAQSSPPPAPVHTPTYRAQTVLLFTDLQMPAGVAVDSAGAVYVADGGGTSRVLKMEPGSSTQTELPWYPGMAWPGGIAVDGAGNVYVSDFGNNTVAKISPGASSPTVLPFPELDDPQGVAVDGAGTVYVAEPHLNRVLALPAGSNSPTVLPFTGLSNPWCVAADAAGDVFVKDNGTNQVLELPAGSSAPVELPFSKAVNSLAVDNAGDVYAATLKTSVYKLAHGATTPTELPFTDIAEPNSVAADNAGNVYVTDRGNRVVKLPMS